MASYEFTQRDQPRMRFVNEAGEVIPPHAVMRMVDTEPGRGHSLKAFKPTGSTSGATFAINLKRRVNDGKAGACTTAYGCWALFVKESGGDPDPAPGDVVGPDDDWALHAGKTGWVVVGGYESFTYDSVSYTRVRVAQVPSSSGNVIYAQVNYPAGVGPGDATFPFINAIALVGDIPPGGADTGQNQYGQTYAHGEWVILSQRKDNGQWITERGGTAGSLVRFFRLTEDLSYSDAFKLALPTLDDWTADSGADEVYLLNPQTDGIGQFYGLAPYTDENTGAASHPGYLASAVKVTDDFDDGDGATGKEAWRIITMEGPADELVVTLAESYSMSGTDVTLVADENPWGEPFGARLPKILADDRIEVQDHLDVASAAQSGDVWFIRWDRSHELYTFWRPKVEAGQATVVKGLCPSPGLTRSDSDFELEEYELVCGVLPTGTLTVVCDPKVNCPTGETIYARFDRSVEGNWTTADAGNFVWHLRGLLNGYGSVKGPIEDPGDGNDPQYAVAGECD